MISERFSIFSTYTSLYELISSALSEGDLTIQRAYEDRIKIVFDDVNMTSTVATYAILVQILTALCNGTNNAETTRANMVSNLEQ